MNSSLLVLVILGACIAAGLIAWIVRNAIHESQARNWLSTEATIQSAGIETIGTGRYSEELPCFAFSYVVGGEYYSGRFALSAKDDHADALIKEMVDRKLIVLYNPKRPSSYFIPNDEMEGYEVRLVSD